MPNEAASAQEKMHQCGDQEEFASCHTKPHLFDIRGEGLDRPRDCSCLPSLVASGRKVCCHLPLVVVVVALMCESVIVFSVTGGIIL